MSQNNPPFFEIEGFCPCCELDTKFSSPDSGFRDHLRCSHCQSRPRERALTKVIEEFYPNWRNLRIHESSPANRGSSAKLKSQCPNYVASKYYGDELTWGKTFSGYRNEDLEHQTFEDESFDLIITQDVFEHLFDIESAFKEIARTLRAGGAHIFTTPLVNFTKPTEVWAKRNKDGTIKYLHDPEYHGSPSSKKGSLVTFHFGYDISDIISNSCGLNTTIVRIDDLRFGIRAKYLEVLITKKR